MSIDILTTQNFSFTTNLTNDNFYSKITIESIKALGLLRKNRVLELGHGLCDHLPFVMKQASDLKYFGMDTNEEMIRKAADLNTRYIDESSALFQVYDGVTIPYVHNIFDRILSINKMYYHNDLVAYFNELYRCLKHGGICVVSFSDSLFLEQLSLLSDQNSYKFYDKNSLTEIINSSEFNLFNITEHIKRIKKSNGSWEDESYFIIRLKKKEKSRYLR